MNHTPGDDDYFLCPHCGAEVAAGASFCRECGASDESGWQDDGTLYDDDDGYSEDDGFDYDEFIRREFPDHASEARRPDTWHFVAGALATMMIFGFIVFVCSGLRL